MKARAVLGRTAGCILLFSLFSCTRPKPLIYVIPRTTATLFWETLHTGALAAAQAHGYRLYWNAATREDDVERQIQLVQQAARRRPAGLILAPDHTAALLTQVRLLVNSGTPVVVIGSRLSLPSGPDLLYILSNHDEAGTQAADRIATLTPSAHIAVVGLDPDLSGDLATTAAFLRELARIAPRATVVDERFSRFNRQETESQVEAILSTGHPLDCIFALSPAALLGSLDALQRRPPPHPVSLIGYGQDMDLVDPLRRGKIDSLILEDTYREGWLATEAIAQRRATGHWPPAVITSTRLVTRADLRDPLVQQRLTMSPER